MPNLIELLRSNLYLNAKNAYMPLLEPLLLANVDGHRIPWKSNKSHSYREMEQNLLIQKKTNMDQGFLAVAQLKIWTDSWLFWLVHYQHRRVGWGRNWLFIHPVLQRLWVPYYSFDQVTAHTSWSQYWLSFLTLRHNTNKSNSLLGPVIRELEPR